MIYAAAAALAGLVNEYRPGASLLPSMNDLRLVSATVAMAVAKTAEEQGLARTPLKQPNQRHLPAHVEAGIPAPRGGQPRRVSREAPGELPEPATMTAIVTDLRRHRGAAPRRALSRSALLSGLQFDAVWLEQFVKLDLNS